MGTYEVLLAIDAATEEDAVAWARWAAEYEQVARPAIVVSVTPVATAEED